MSTASRHHSRPLIALPRTGWRLAHGLMAGAALCAALAGCASGASVTSANKPDTYTVSASATGGRLAWARAHQRALAEATDYCQNRGLQTSFVTERMDGQQTFEQQNSVIEFECHPKL
jgi:hypothetical protein